MGSLETEEVVLYEVKVDKELEACSNFFFRYRLSSLLGQNTHIAQVWLTHCVTTR